MIITITGATGSGKTTISHYLQSLNKNIIVVEIDKIAHNIVNKYKDLIKNKLNINFNTRKELSNLVFNNNDLLNKLEVITWYYMEKEIDNIINENKNKIIILDYALITKTKYFNNSIKILVKSFDNIRKNRIIKRDNITSEEYYNRNKNILEYNEKDFNYIIINNINYKNDVNIIYKKILNN